MKSVLGDPPKLVLAAAVYTRINGVERIRTAQTIQEEGKCHLTLMKSVVTAGTPGEITTEEPAPGHSTTAQIQPVAWTGETDQEQSSSQHVSSAKRKVILTISWFAVSINAAFIPYQLYHHNWGWAAAAVVGYYLGAAAIAEHQRR